MSSHAQEWRLRDVKVQPRRATGGSRAGNSILAPDERRLSISRKLATPKTLAPDIFAFLSILSVVNMKAELQEVMDMLRKLQGSIDFGNAPMAEREELAGDVSEIMDTLFEVMKQLPNE